MKSLVGKIFGVGSKLSALESLILHSVRDRLNEDEVILWDKQVSAINKVQRLPEGIEVNFYRMKGGSPCFDEALAFDNKAEELKLATIQIRVPNVQETLSASVWCVKGFVFSIEYKGSVNYFEEAAGMDPAHKMQIDCKVEAELSPKI